MFTGIIEVVAEVLSDADNRLTIERPASFDDIATGSSISVSGVCLTVADLDENTLSFDVVAETREKSAWGTIVNLERALPASGRFDGHIVQGHSEGTGEIVSRDEERISIRIPQALLSFVHPKGSIAIDGISLTVASLRSDICTIALIPHTLEKTTLGKKKAGDTVNLETDVLVRSALLKQ